MASTRASILAALFAALLFVSSAYAVPMERVSRRAVPQVSLIKPNEASLWSPLKQQTIVLQSSEPLDEQYVNFELCRPSLREADYLASCMMIDYTEDVVTFADVSGTYLAQHDLAHDDQPHVYKIKVHYKVVMQKFSEQWELRVIDAAHHETLAVSMPFTIIQNMEPTGESDYLLDHSENNLLGRGGFGNVFSGVLAAENRLLRNGEYMRDDTVAVKVIRLQNTECWKLVKGEVDIMKLVDHPHVMRIIDEWQVSRHVHDKRSGSTELVREWNIVMPRAGGGDLHDLMSNQALFQRAVERGHVKSIARQTLEALQYLHGMGVIHRDLKPENILFKEEYTADSLRPPHVLLADFGLSCLEKGASDTHGRAVTCGTAGYIAPEFFEAERERERQDAEDSDVELVMRACPWRPKTERSLHDSKVDMWSFGMMLYYMFDTTPNRRTQGSNDDAEYLRHVNFVRREWYPVSPVFVSFLKAVLHQNPLKRLGASEALEHPFFKDPGARILKPAAGETRAESRWWETPAVTVPPRPQLAKKPNFAAAVVAAIAKPNSAKRKQQVPSKDAFADTDALIASELPQLAYDEDSSSGSGSCSALDTPGLTNGTGGGATTTAEEENKFWLTAPEKPKFESMLLKAKHAFKAKRPLAAFAGAARA